MLTNIAYCISLWVQLHTSGTSPFLVALIGHTIFELGENTDYGMNFINEYFIHPGYFSWPGGKNYADSRLNMVGDTFFFALGWLLSAYLDVIGTKRKWYTTSPKG